MFIGDHDDDFHEEIGWFGEVTSRPSLLIRPLCIIAIIGAAAVLSFWSVTSPHPIAEHIREICSVAWPYAKILLIISTFLGVNGLIWQVFFVEDGVAEIREIIWWFVLPWPLNMPYIRIGMGINVMITANLLMAWGIYNELPPEWQSIVSQWWSPPSIGIGAVH